MNEQMKKLEELQNKKASYIRKASSVQSRIDAITEKELLPSLRKEYIGRYFIFNNSDGEEHWPLYRKILDIERVWIVNGGKPMVFAKLFEFQSHKGCRDRQLVIEIGNGTDFSLDGMGLEITEKEFKAAWAKMLDKLEKSYK